MKWKPNAAARRQYGEQMENIRRYCQEHGITVSESGDSYYFEIGGTPYRVSNHTVEASNAGAYDERGEKVRPLYHPEGREPGTVYITAGKTRIIEIHTALLAGEQLDSRGRKI